MEYLLFIRISLIHRFEQALESVRLQGGPARMVNYALRSSKCHTLGSDDKDLQSLALRIVFLLNAGLDCREFLLVVAGDFLPSLGTLNLHIILSRKQGSQLQAGTS